MAKKFVIRFASILFLALIVIALGIHFLFSKEVSVVAWILGFPVILLIPIVLSVVMAKDEELGIPNH